MLSKIVSFSFFTFIWLLFPEKAFAWGPAAHLQIGIEALKNIGLLEHGLQMLLLAHPFDYLYGCIGVDIIFAKGLAKLHEHSHCWAIGFSVLEEASTPAQEAFAYGYLCHLAADAIAHNYFIPECVIRNYSAKTFRHVYWEMRFDSLAKKDLWDLAQEIASLPQHNEDDQLLEKVVKRTLFSFKTDRRIFHSILTINHMQQWQKMMDNLSERSPWKLSNQDANRYINLSFKNSFDFLLHLKKADCLKMDPTGKDALLSAKWIRRNLRMLGKKGKLKPGLYSQALKSLQPKNNPTLPSLLMATQDFFKIPATGT